MTPKFTFLLLIISLILNITHATSDYENINLERFIDISSTIEKVIIKLSIKNIGTQNLKYYSISIPNEKMKHLSFITAQSNNILLKIQKYDSNKLHHIFHVEWNSDLIPNKIEFLILKMHFTHIFYPLPEFIQQKQDQYVKYRGNSHFYSPYKTLKQKTEYKIGTSKIESFNPKFDINQIGSKIVAGPFYDIEKFTFKTFDIHYENNSPFITMSNVIREIDVSHWGQISISEFYDMKNTGAKLKGTFSMLDQNRGLSNKAAFRSLKAKFPKYITNVYFRDRIGNISSSSLRYSKTNAFLKIDSRYTLYGGWKNDFEFGYQVPSGKYIRSKPDILNLYQLNFPFYIPFHGCVVDNLTVKIIFPEGATDIKYNLPYDVNSQSKETRFSYLDTIGRPVITFNKKNVVDFHRKKFQIYYRLSHFSIFRKPFVLFCGFLISFMVYMAFTRLDLSLPRNKDNKSVNSKEK